MGRMKEYSMEMKKKRLPYDFDLYYDVKYMYEVEMIAKGEPHCSDADGYDLYKMFSDLGMEIPDCLLEFSASVEVERLNRVEELEERVAFLEEEIRWRKELLKSRTQSLYQLIQKAQDAVQDINEEDEEE